MADDGPRATLDCIDYLDGLRHEMESRFTGIDSRISQVVDAVASVREESARNEGKLDALIAELGEERKSRQVYEAAATAALAASTEITRARAMSQIESDTAERVAVRAERLERTRTHREIALRIFAGIAAIWTAISTYLLAR